MTVAMCVEQAIADLHRFFKSTIAPESIACAIVGPVMGEGGFIVPPIELMTELARICREHGTLLVAVEVQTGFGRTGRMFACDRIGIAPDLVSLAKSLSNGLPLSAVVGRADVMDAAEPGGLGGTFGGNPISCAAALGAIETIEQDGLAARAESIGATVAECFERLASRYSFIADVRGIGAMRAIELVEDPVTLAPDRARTQRVLAGAASRGLLLLSAGLYGNVIRTLMPLTITDEELEEGLSVLESSIEEAA
jgi:4-aminobutyrate aminotransferase/(S)-3-amino-2-methylpropionate transaminase